LDALVEAVGRDHIETGHRVTDLHLTGEDRSGGGTDSARSNADRQSSEGSATTASDGGVSSGATASATAPASEPGATSGDARRVDAITVETDDGTERLDADAVVVAAMPNVLEELTGYRCSIDFQGAVCALVTVPEPVTDTYWLNVAHDAPFGALIEHTNFVPPARYGGAHLLYLASYVQSPDEWLWQADDGTIRDRWLSHLGEMFPDFDPADVERFRLARNPRAAPVYERGYLEKVVPYDLRDAVAAGVYYAGMASRAQYPERSLNGGVVAGYEVADRIDEVR
jgi:protoporphyrinogen oxidase